MPPPMPPLPSSIRHPPHPYSKQSYFRQLWSHSPHRPLLLRSLSQLPPPHTPSDNLLYEEALLQVAIAARCTSESRSSRLEQIAICSTAIAVGGVSDWAGGLLMACARAADIVGGKAGSMVSGKICKLVQGWGEGLGVRTFVGALETGLVLDGLGVLPQEQMGLVMRAVAEGLERGEEWGDLALTVLGKGVWQDMVMVVDVVGGGWSKVLEAAERQMSHGRVGQVCVAVLGYLAEREGIEGGRARDALHRCLEMDCVRFCSGGSGSSRKGGEWGVLVEGMKMAGRVGGGCSFVGALEAMVWEGKPLGTDLLYEAFIAVPGLRRRVIKGLQVGLCSGKKTVATLFCSLLEALCAGAIGSRDVGEEIIALLDAIDRMPRGVDCKVMNAVAKFAGVVPSMTDRVWGYLRKGVGSRVRRSQFIVSSGLLAMIEVGVGDEAVPLLESIFNRGDARVRRHIMELIIRLNRERAGKMNEIMSLVDAILKSMAALKESDIRKDMSTKRDEEIKAAFKFSKCFERAGGTWLVRDELPISLKFCKELSVGVADSGEFSSQLKGYMQDISLGVYDACQPREDVAPVRMRIKQLCTIFETMSCIDFQCVSNSHVSAYAIALLIRDYLAAQSSAAKTKCDTEGTYRLMDTSTDLHPLALLTIEEASALKRNDTDRGEEIDLLPLLGYMGALRALSEEVTLPRLIVQAELLGLFVKRVQREVRLQRFFQIDSEDACSLVHLVKSSFLASGPWVSPVWQGNACQTTEDGEMNGKTAANIQDEIDNHDRRQSSRSLGHFEMSCETIRASSLGEDVKKAVSVKQLQKISERTLLTIREYMLQVVLFLLSHQATSMEWIELLSFLKDAPVQHESSTEFAPRLRSKSDAAVHKSIQVRIVAGLSGLFRLEFDRSLSISLTLTYLDIFDFVVGKVDESSHLGQMIREIALSTMKSILRDYSIQHVRVLRRMTMLILKSSTVKAALEYSAEIIAWLGNESCLLNSNYTAKEDGSSAIGTEDFDMDIVEEAIRMDAERDLDEDAACNEPVEEESITEPGLESIDSERNNDTRLATDIRKARGEADSVKSLCFNETTEGALVAMDCILGYCGTLLRSTSDQLKRGKRDSMDIVLKNQQETVPGAVYVFRQFLSTPFGEIRSKRPLRMPVPMQRRIIALFQSLLEISETMLRMLMREERDSSKRVDTRMVTSICEGILELLFDEEIVPGNFANLCVAIPEHQGTRLTLLQERMDSTCTSILISVNRASDKHWKTLSKLLRRRVNKIHQMPKRKLETSDPASSWTASKQRTKKQRMRSRNQYVDGWLHEETGDDNYADLEDFIVPVDATDL